MIFNSNVNEVRGSTTRAPNACICARQEGLPLAGCGNSAIADKAMRHKTLGYAWAIAFALILACSRVAAAVEQFKIGGTGAGLGTMQRLADEFMARNPYIRIIAVPSLGSTGGIKAVVAGAIGLAVTSRPMNESERGRGAVQTDFSRTPFVFAVSTRSKVLAITSEELVEIYAGTRVTWADGTPVRIVLRPNSDTDSRIIRNMSSAIAKALEAASERPGVQVSVNDQDAADDLERIRGAIGPSSLALIVSERRALRALALDGKEPTPRNAVSGIYPHHKRLFMVTGTKSPSAVRRFVAFVKSPAGRKLIEGNGQWIP
ncbi:MAG: hypothetical protein A3G25_21755 [Betaproteobacteria bacterium RIFCSPLOWO2_12_FULL_63_13]|nr:MAG: hypothetical protein A3G25_21755 [Betaproteobacteria bacterium RIFCSPLOWO2_12_FULL_63_13]